MPQSIMLRAKFLNIYMLLNHKKKKREKKIKMTIFKIFPHHYNILYTIRLSRIKFREISSGFLLETDFRFEFLVRKYASAENFKYIRQRGIRKVLNFGLKAEKQLQTENHIEELALGSHPRDNGDVTH